MPGFYESAAADIAAGEEKVAASQLPGSTIAPPAAPPPAQNPADVLPGLPAESAAPAPAQVPATAPAPGGVVFDIPPAPAPASPAARPDFYATAAADLAQQDAARLQTALDIARKQDPDKYAEASRIATRDGLPVDFVAANLDDLKSQGTANDMRKALEASPRLKNWFLTGDNANTVKLDDLHKLSGLNWLMSATAENWKEGWDQRNNSEVRFRQMFGKASPEEIAAADAADKQDKRDYGVDGFFQGAIPATAQQLPNMIGGLAEGMKQAPYRMLAGTAVGALAGSMAGGIGAGPGAVAGFGVGLKSGMIAGRAFDSFKQEAGGAYSEFLGVKGDNGEKLDPDVMRGAALIAGAANAALETLGEAAVERMIPGLDKFGVGSLLKQGSRAALKEAMTRPTVAAALKTFGKNVAFGVGGEVSTEVMQEAVTILGRISAEKLSPGSFQTMEPGEIAARLADTAEQTAQAMVALTPALAGPKLVRDYKRTRAAVEMQSVYEGANEAAKATELRERAPEKYLDAVRSFLSDGKAADTVYVPVEKMAEMFQSLELTPADLDARIDGFSQRYAEAAATGSDVQIPMAEYQTYIAGTPLGDKLIEHQRWQPDMPTVNEAREAETEAKANQDAALQEALDASRAEEARAAPRQQVERDVADRLMNIGESPDVARAQASVHGAFFDTLAQRTGTNALDLYKAQNLDVRRAMPDGLDYRKTDELDIALDAVRRGDGDKAARLRQRGQGPSLGAFLANQGGLVESDSFAGELRARDLGKRNGGRLLAKEGAGGLDLDTASLRAAEAGYFPSAVNEDGTVNREGLVEALLSALDEEGAGRGTFAVSADDVKIDPQLARVESLSSELASLGLDTASMSNEEIRAELMKATSPNATEGALFQFAGERALAAQPASTGAASRVDEAQGMAARGAYPDEIYDATGMFKGPDGKWRLEFVDTDAKLDAAKFEDQGDGTQRFAGRLADVLDHPALYAIYPMLADMRATLTVRPGQNEGVYLPGVGRVEVQAADLDGVRSVALHEIAHAIQHIEGFAFGGNSSMGEVYEGEAVRSHLSAIEKNKEQQLTVARIYDSGQAREKAVDLMGQLLTREQQLQEDLRKAAGYEYYRRLAGEVEARNVQERDRRRRAGEEELDSPRWTEDVSQSDQIVLTYAPKRGVVFQSMAAGAAPQVREFYQTTGAEALAAKSMPRAITAPDFSTLDGLTLDGNKVMRDGAQVATLKLDADLTGAVPHVRIADIEVRPGERGKGVGSSIIRAVVAQSHAAGLPVALTSDAMRGKAGQAQNRALYERLGFVKNKGAAKIKGVSEEYVLAPREFYQTTGAADLAGKRADKRGSIQFMDTGTVINLFQQANLSTFLHESGHLFLEVNKQVAEAATAPDAVKADWRTILDFIGANEGQPIERESHEKFAKAFETYLSEGKAPSVELQGVFERFKGWLLGVYRGAARLIGLPAIPAEIRAVFDRMLATDAEIAQVQQDPSYTAMFKEAADAGMTDQQWQSYNKAAQHATDEAKGQLMAKLVKDKWREQTKEWRAAKEEIRREVFEEMSQRPVYQAQHFIRTGEDLAGLGMLPAGLDRSERRMDRGWLVNRFGKDVLARLPKQVPPVYVERGGMNPDEMADAFGFSSGEHMVSEMMSAPPLARALNARVDELMRERNGDLISNQAAMADAAIEAMNNDARGTFLETELKALNRLAGNKGAVTPRQQARATARQVIRAKRVGEATRPGPYTAARDRAARAAEAAMLKGDFAEAANQKRRQILNHYLAQEASAAREEAESVRRYLDRFSDRKRPAGVDPEYLDQIEGILERFEFKRSTSLPAIERRKSLAQFVEEATARGDAILVPPDLLDKAQLVSYKDMTMEDLSAMRDVVKNVEHLGRLKNRLLEKGRLKSFEAARDELVGQAMKTPPKKKQKYRNATNIEKFWNGVAGIDAYLLKMEQVFQWLDMGDVNGPFTRVIFQKFVDAQNRKSEMQLAVATKLKTILDGLDAGYLAERKAVPLRPELTFTRAEIYAIALNQGTESNRAKILKGEFTATNSFRTEAEMDSALSILTKEDWDRVQSMWDVLEGFWPETAALERRITGVEPPKLERRKVVTEHGEYAGGYYPMVYDPVQAFDVQMRTDKDLDSAFDNSTFSRPAVEHGFTKKRTDNYSRPVLLDLRAMTDHIDKAIQNITHREPVRDTLKLLSDPALQGAIIETMGRPVYGQMVQWLDRIAKDRGEASTAPAIQRALSTARANVSLYAMGFRLSTALSQLAGFSNSTELVKPSFLGGALAASIRHPIETWEMVAGKSGEMRDRTNNMERDVRTALGKLEGKTGVVDEFKRYAFFMTAMADKTVCMPTWLGAYNQHLATYPTDEAGAVRAGDRAVRLTQGSGAAKDLSGIMGDKNGVAQVFTLFYSYFNLYYNRLRTLGRDTRVMLRDGEYEDIPHLLARSVALVILPSIMADALVGKWKDDDESWAWWAFRKASLYPLMSLPVARDVAGALDSGLGYQMSPLGRFGELAVKSIQDVNKLAHGEDVDARLASKRAAELAGYAFGLPLGQGVSTASNVWQGLEQNDGKWLKDLTLGRRAFGDTRDK